MTTCESCGREETDLTKVQRVYLVSDEPESVDPGSGIESATPTAGDIELWCASCCATFPHSMIDAD